MKQYLAVSEHIDWDDPSIQTLAKTLRGEHNRDLDIARACYEFVRDDVRHSWDYKIDVITCKASDVLTHKTGYCYAQSHLLAALLRANGIAAGLCYQRLSLEGNGAPYCLHGLNAVYLNDFGWYRVDPRGNKDGVDAQFCPPLERLAFSTGERLEADIQGVWPEPLAVVVDALSRYDTCFGVYENLPDLEMYA